MLNSNTINELNKAFKASPEGFLVVEEGRPRFAVLDYQTYQRLKPQKHPSGPRKAKKILVTGGAGYIGSVAARLLQKQPGYEVVVYDNLSTGRREAARGLKLVQADLADRAALDQVFKEEQIDAVMHFAASTEVEESVRNPSKYYQNNVIHGLNLLDAMIENNVSKLVFSSTGAVYGQPDQVPIKESAACRPLSPYGETKLIFENILKRYEEAYGLCSVSLRYFNAAGAWTEENLGYFRQGQSHLIPRVLETASGRRAEIEVYGQDYPTPDGTAIRDYVHVLDLAEAHLLALKKLEQSNGAYLYNLGTGQGHSVLEVIDLAVEVTGRMIPMQITARRAGDPPQHVADSSKFQKEFAWQPQHDLKSILESSWQWHQR